MLYGAISIFSLQRGTRETVVAGNQNVATRAAEEVLCVPLYGSLTESDVDRICDMILAIRDSSPRDTLIPGRSGSSASSVRSAE